MTLQREVRDPFSHRQQTDEDDSRQEETVRHQRLLYDFKKVLSTREGRAVVWQILSDAGIYRSSFDRDAVAMAFNEGQRNVGLRLLDRVMTVDKEAFTTMQEEANERRSDGS